MKPSGTSSNVFNEACVPIPPINTITNTFTALGTSAHRPCFDLSVCLQPVCLSPDSQSDCLRFFSPPRPPLVDSLDSKLWYRSGCRAAALASAAPRPLGSLFGSFSPRGARSKGDQQPDGRVAHNQKLFNHPGCRYKDSRHPCPTRKEDS